MNSISFSSRSEMLAGALSTRLVQVWDLQSNRTKYTFSEHTEEVTQVIWNSIDSQIVSSSLSGEIIIHSMVTGIAIANFKQHNSTGIKLLCFSPLKKQLLAAASESGSVYIWDCTTRSVMASFAGCHHSPVTGLSFSQVNPTLMCTSGLDSRIQFYDTNEKKIVKTLETEAPLSSMAFHHDGHTIAAGTLHGTILLYDMRYRNSPVQLRGHEGEAVNCVEFMNVYPKVKSSELSAVAKSTEGNSINRLRSIEEIKKEAKRRVEMSRLERVKEAKINNELAAGLEEEPANRDAPVKNEQKTYISKQKSLLINEKSPMFNEKQPVFTEKPPVFKEKNATRREKSPVVKEKTLIPKEKSPEQPPAIEGKPRTSVKRVNHNELKLIRDQLDLQEEAIYDLAEDMQSLHVEVIRQFTIQQTEIQSLFEQYSTANSSLLQELQSLRDENAKLKSSS